jgi:putative ABC transport system substrate-binding protein
MRRRDVMALLAAAPALWARKSAAQQPNAKRRIAWFGLGEPGTPSPYVEALRAGLRELGWVEDQNVILDLHWASGREDMEGVARKLLLSNPDVVVSQELMTIAMRAVRGDKPVVFGFSGDPVDAKLVESWARPGGNFTGLSYLALELVGKRVELLKEWVPQLNRIAVLARPQHPGEHLERQATEAVVHRLGMELAYFPYVSTTSLPTRDFTQLEKTFRDIADARCDGLLVFPDSAMFEVNDKVSRFAIEARLPSVSGWSPFARNGLLLTYGPDVREIYRALGRYVDRILRGTTPGSLPVEVPSKVELVINAKTARALNLAIPPSLLARADEVIE